MNTTTPTPSNITGDEEGSIMLEFTASVIILIVIYLGLITLGLRIDNYQAIQMVVRDGGREMAITGNLNQAEQIARQSGWVWGLNPEKLYVSFNTYDAGSRKMVDCSAQYLSSPFSSFFPLLVGEEPMDEKMLHAEAIFGWWDVVE